MDERTRETIRQCIVFLNNHGYEIKECGGHKVENDNKVGKWVAFKQDGIDCILHGKVICDYVGSYCVRCKNACRRYVGINQIVAFYDSKQECYKHK